MSIVIKDLEVLEKFSKDIESTYKISEVKMFDKRTNKTYTEYSLKISNKDFVSHIINYGVTYNKTNILNFPKIEEEFYPSFIAGLFDGDGSVYIKDNGVSKTLGCNLISTKEVIDHINV